MQQNFTLNNKLIAYLFNESNILDNALIEAEIEQNEDFKLQYEQLSDSIGMMEKDLVSPSTASIELIEMMGALRFDSLAKS